jgi:GNAT superfamily N-acetyltransferase
VNIERGAPDDAEAIAAAHVDAWRETYAGLLPPSIYAAKTVEMMTPRWRDSLERGEAVFVVRDGTAIEGVALAGARRDETLPFEADVRAIYLRRRAQGFGLGRRLMAAMASDLLARDFRGCGLWALESNMRARRFYEMLGGRVVATSTEHAPDGSAVHVGYGWNDVSAWLISPPRPETGG